MKMIKALTASTLLLAIANPASADDHADQIAGAVLAAPENKRAEATVLGWRGGQTVELRKGSNEFVCLADNPANDGFSAACYHETLEPFMARGRELSAAGIKGSERRQTRFQEIERGELAMPRDGRTLHVLTGDAYDAASGTVTNGKLRWVIYVPFATAESTGLQTAPARGVPWLMDPGTAGAHIMITPP